MPLPSWLPELACVNPWTSETFEALYAVFVSDFKYDPPVYESRPVWVFPEQEDGKEIIFWHMISRDDPQAGERLPDLRRSERLPWVRPMIEHPNDREILAWDYREADGSVKTYIWLVNHDFLALLKKYSDGRRRLLTSYHIDYPHYRRKLERKYARRLK